MISIIIPVYNQAKLLERCLASIKRQIYNNYEIIVIDDGSTDGIDLTRQKYTAIFGHKLIYFNHEHKGANPARNHGARRAQGEYLIFCDADVEMKPDMLELMLNALKNDPQASFTYSSFKWGGWKTFVCGTYKKERLKQMPYINTTSLIRKEHFPGFDEKIKKFQDWDLWLTMLNQGHGGIWINQILFKVNTGGSQTMSSWLPSFAYKLLPGLPQVKKYNQAVKIIKQKHNLV